MTYQILTSRWRCPECGAGVRLFFSRSTAAPDENSEDFICDRVLCEMGHDLPDDIAQEAMQLSDDEFYAALERGEKISEVWNAPEVDQDPSQFG